jgi:hypothetical protein
VVALQLAIALSCAAPPPAHGQEDPLAVCHKQRYALCATASCLVYNQVAYCKCDVQYGDSISESDTIPEGNICAVNRDGYGNGYAMSTYSLPASVRAGGNKAIYTCPGATATGAYAQCDGGFCFGSTRGRRFPGFGVRLKANEVICSCPISVAGPSTDTAGYQIVGPYPCQERFFDNCFNAVANTNTGSMIAVGAPTGTPRFLTNALDGGVPPLNYCLPPP